MKSQQFTNYFWRRWIREYLPELTRRSKWCKYTKNVKVGDVVILIDENNPTNCRPKGRVVEVYPGKDGQVRKARKKQ